MKTILLFLISLFCLTIQAQYNFEQIDVWSGSSGGGAKHITHFANELYFQSFEIVPSLRKLYKTDGTQAGTSVIAPNLNFGNGYTPSSLTPLNGELIFTAFKSNLGTELFKTDGTDAGTVLIKEIRPGSSGGLDLDFSENQSVFVEFNGELYFRGYTDTSIELWKTDGTETGTVSVKNFEAIQGAPTYFNNAIHDYFGVVFNNELYFIVRRSSIGISELWKTDGTTVGTKKVRGGFGSINNLTVYDNTLYFSAQGDSAGREIWVSDGTLTGTQLKHDIFPNNLNPFFGTGSTPDDFFVFNNELYFSARGYDAANNTIIGRELYKTNGTEASLVKNINTTIGTLEGSGLNTPSFTSYNNQLYFIAKNGANNDYGLWKTDGTEAGTIEVVSPSDTGETFQFRGATVYDGLLFYFNFQHLWVTDGTPSGTEQLTDSNGVNSSITSVNYPGLVEFNNKLWFQGSSFAFGDELTSLGNTNSLSVLTPNSNPKLSIYPNPTEDVLHVQSPKPITQIEIFNLTGQLVHSTFAKAKIDVSSLPSGVYMAKIETENNVMTKKIIKN